MLSVIQWIVFCGINVLIARINTWTVQRRRKTDPTHQINHPVWGLVYTILCTIPYIWTRDWCLCVSFLALHLSVFPVFYNDFDHQPAFNLSKTSKSWTDRTMVKMGLHSTEIVNIGALIFSLAFLTCSIFHL